MAVDRQPPYRLDVLGGDPSEAKPVVVEPVVVVADESVAGGRNMAANDFGHAQQAGLRHEIPRIASSTRRPARIPRGPNGISASASPSIVALFNSAF